MTDKTFYGAALALCVLATAQGVELLWSGNADNGESEAWVRPPYHSRLQSLVKPFNVGVPFALSDYAPGQCVYVVVYSPTCGASRAAAQQWVHDYETGATTPAGWRFVWVSTSDSMSSAGFLPEGFPVPSLVSVAGRSLLTEAGVRAFPSHLVLNRQGVVTEGDVGGDVPHRGVDGVDCTLAPQEVRGGGHR